MNPDEERIWITPAPAGEVDEGSPGEPIRRPTWWMRRSLKLESPIKSMRIEIVCLGYYELYVNGRWVDEEPLAPSLTRLDRRGLAVGHDLTEYLQSGLNCLAIWCSAGWYMPHQFEVHEHASPLLGIRLLGEDEAARDENAAEGWRSRESNRSVVGAWRWNQFGGEEVDAAAFVADWNRTGCSLDDWHPVRRVSAPPIAIDHRTCPPNRIGEEYSAQSVRKLADRHYEVDFGTCLSGWVDIQWGLLAAGQIIILRFYDLPADQDREKDHSYGQYSIYHARGSGSERFTNKFNYAGFRYLTIEGMEELPPLNNMRALLVESAMDQVGHFRCSNALYNRIHDLNLHTLRCLNLGGYSVDCPHRERMGYGADGQTALPGYLYLLYSEAFLRKWLVDWSDVYEADSGRISLCAPNIHAQHAPAWGGIVAPLAWALYLFYGDRTSMEHAFPYIQGHLRYLQRAVRDGVIRKEALGSAFHADWVPPGRGMESGNRPDLPMRELFNSCYLVMVWELFIKMCRVLGREEHIDEGEKNIALLREGIHREFYDEQAGLYLIPEQAYQAMALLAGAVPTDLVPSIRKKLIGLIEQKGWHMDTGLPGTTLLLDLLERMGEHEVIGRIYNQESYPGWGYMLAQGATTIWEQWNGFWSQIHSCFAGPAAWFYSGLAGIKPEENNPGFRQFKLAPAFLPELDYVEASYDSAAGLIKSGWRREAHRITWSVVIPAGTDALLSIPVGSPDNIMVNGSAWPGESRSTLSKKNELLLEIELAAGSHKLEWEYKS